MAETVERLGMSTARQSGEQNLPIGSVNLGEVLVTVYESLHEPGKVIIDIDHEDSDVRVYVNDGIIHDG